MKNGILHWSARIISIIAILFLSLFAFDSFAPGMPVWKQLLGFMIHLTPNLILTGILILAWKKELAGGIVFVSIAVITAPFLFIWNYNMNHSVWMSLSVILLLAFPFLLAGCLFILSYYKKKRDTKISG